MKEDIMLGFLVLVVFIAIAYGVKKVTSNTQSLTI